MDVATSYHVRIITYLHDWDKDLCIVLTRMTFFPPTKIFLTAWLQSLLSVVMTQRPTKQQYTGHPQACTLPGQTLWSGLCNSLSMWKEKWSEILNLVGITSNDLEVAATDSTPYGFLGKVWVKKKRRLRWGVLAACSQPDLSKSQFHHSLRFLHSPLRVIPHIIRYIQITTYSDNSGRWSSVLSQKRLESQTFQHFLASNHLVRVFLKHY